MRCLRFPPLSLICLLITLASALLRAQPSPVVYSNQLDGLDDPAIAATASAAQVKFAKPVTYGTIGDWAVSVAIQDLNNDGKPDMVVANRTSSTIAVLLGNGDGTFQTPVTYNSGGGSYDQGGGVNSVVIGDVNGDGNPDLVVANQNSTVGVLLGNGNGTFQTAVTYGSGGVGPVSVAVADLNGNGKLDIIVANNCAAANNCPGEFSPSSVGVLLNNGDGTFQTAVTYSTGGTETNSIAVADVNGDGKPDVLVVNGGPEQTGSVGVVLGNGDGTFQTAVTYSVGGLVSGSVAVADLNGDGKLDMVVTNLCEETGDNSDCPSGVVSVLLGNGNGTFQPAMTYVLDRVEITSVAIGDVNGDGRPDLVVSNPCLSPGYCNIVPSGVRVLLGNGDGTFQAPVSYGSGGGTASVGGPASSVAIADLNGDGRPDVVVANQCISRTSCEGAAGVLLNYLAFSTKTSLTSSPNPSLVSQSVTFTATITSSSAIPNGSSVTFYDGTASIGTGATTNGVASLTTSFSKAKTYTIKASYGDAFRKASAGTVNQVVEKQAPPYGVVSPTAVNFGDVAVGQTSPTKNISLKDTGESQLKVSAISISGDFAIPTDQCANGVAPGTHCNVYVTFTPRTAGTLTGTLTFTDNASNSPQTVSLTGTGASAASEITWLTVGGRASSGQGTAKELWSVP
jgi:hypothetical protein